MNSGSEQIGRRRFLSGMGAYVALPAMASLGSEETKSIGRTATGAPLRTAYLYAPNGVILDKWRP